MARFGHSTGSKEDFEKYLLGRSSSMVGKSFERLSQGAARWKVLAEVRIEFDDLGHGYRVR